MSHDGGFISHLLHEAENERMHLMVSVFCCHMKSNFLKFRQSERLISILIAEQIWMKCLQPNGWNRLLVLAVQGVFFNAYFLGYMCSPRLCHRIAGYLEEEAVVSYTHFLDALDTGALKNPKAPQIALGKNNLFHGLLLFSYYTISHQATPLFCRIL
jgi:ubiquinol oxidase